MDVASTVSIVAALFHKNRYAGCFWKDCLTELKLRDEIHCGGVDDLMIRFYSPNHLEMAEAKVKKQGDAEERSVDCTRAGGENIGFGKLTLTAAVEPSLETQEILFLWVTLSLHLEGGRRKQKLRSPRSV